MLYTTHHRHIIALLATSYKAHGTDKGQTSESEGTPEFFPWIKERYGVHKTQTGRVPAFLVLGFTVVGSELNFLHSA